MTYKIHPLDVADFFLAMTAEQDGDAMHYWKLNILCYLAQGWHLAYFDKPLFEHEVEAGFKCPMVSAISYLYKKGSRGFTSHADLHITRKSPLSQEQKDFLTELWRKYGSAQTSQLIKLTSMHKCFNDCNAQEVIQKDHMRGYFVALLLMGGQENLKEYDNE